MWIFNGFRRMGLDFWKAFLKDPAEGCAIIGLVVRVFIKDLIRLVLVPGGTRPEGEEK